MDQCDEASFRHADIFERAADQRFGLSVFFEHESQETVVAQQNFLEILFVLGFLPLFEKVGIFSSNGQLRKDAQVHSWVGFAAHKEERCSCLGFAAAQRASTRSNTLFQTHKC